LPYYERDDYKLFYEDTGEGSSSIVFIHGYLGSSRSHWGKQLDDQKLYSKFQLVAPDLRGFAKSSLGKFVEKNKTEDIINDIHYLITEVLKLENPILIGYSVGATICVLYHLKYTNTVKGLVLVGPRPFISKSTRSWNFLAKEKRTDEKQKSASSFTWSIVKRLQKFATYVSTFIQKRRKKDFLKQISEIEIPVLMIFSKKDTVSPQIVFNTYKENLPSQTEYYEHDGDHGIANNQPDVFTQLLLKFFEKNYLFTFK
jgi:pimeloyl-ACP methyl ester carboxylesterase